MNSLLAILASGLFVALVVLDPKNGSTALLVLAPLGLLAGWLTSRAETDRTFLMRLLAGALLARLFLGTLIYLFAWQDFFGGDANTYDFFGLHMARAWDGDAFSQMLVDRFSAQGGSGWGMLYLVGAIYKVIGQNPLAVQFVAALLGASTAVVMYLTALEIFDNRRVARLTALFSAFFPSLILWSSQGLKDGPIVFLLAVTMLATLKLGARFSVKHLAVLTLALFGLLTLRFYIFYMVVAAIAVAFIIGTRAITAQSLARQVLVMIVMTVALFYFGVTRYAGQQFETYGNLEMVQRTRADSAISAESGFGANMDVSTPAGALAVIPLGLTFLLLSPFPWQMTSLRSIITLPEMIVWWCSLPLLVTGAWFTLRHRLRPILPILIFTVLLTLSYSVFEGNIGNAYRQRAQLLIFYFVFVSVGFVLMREGREEKVRRAQKEPLTSLPRGPGWRPGKRARKGRIAVQG